MKKNIRNMRDSKNKINIRAISYFVFVIFCVFISRDNKNLLLGAKECEVKKCEVKECLSKENDSKSEDKIKVRTFSNKLYLNMNTSNIDIEKITGDESEVIESEISKSDLEKISQQQEKINKVSNELNMSVSTKFIEKLYNSDRGYNSFSTLSDGKNMQEYYKLLKNMIYNFYDSKKDLEPSTQLRGGLLEKVYYIGQFSFRKYNLSLSEALAVYFTIRNDMPYFYFLPYEVMTTNTSLLIFTNEEYAKYSDRLAYYEKIESKIDEYENITNNCDTAYEKVYMIHDKIIREIDYTEGDTDKASSHNIIGPLCEKDTVCEGYARTAQLLLNDIGIENVFVSGIGKLGNRSEPHAWNEIKLDDNKWYGFDFTWDDTPSAKGGVIYDNFGVSKSIFEKSHNAGNKKNVSKDYLYDVPTISDTTCPYSYNTIIKNTSKITKDGITYEIKGIYAMVDSYTGNASSITIPQKVSNKVVIGINAGAFANCTSIKSIEMPDTLVIIDDDSKISGAFENCINLEVVKLSEYVNYIGDKSFDNCISLKSINLPSKYEGKFNASSVFELNKYLSIKNFVKSFNYTGKKIVQNIKLYRNGTLINENIDYKVTYSNNQSVGTATMVITGIGIYKGTIKKTYSINPSQVKKLIMSKRGIKCLKLKWSSMLGVSGYRIERYSAKTKKYIFIKNVSKTEYVDSKLDSATSYYYRVLAYKGSKKGKYSSACLCFTKPSTPKKIKIVSKKTKKVNITIVKRDNPTIYQIYRKKGANGKYKLIKNLNYKQLSYTDKNLSKKAIYYYKVRECKTVKGIKAYGSYTKPIKVKCR